MPAKATLFRMLTLLKCSSDENWVHSLTLSTPRLTGTPSWGVHSYVANQRQSFREERRVKLSYNAIKRRLKPVRVAIRGKSEQLRALMLACET